MYFYVTVAQPPTVQRDNGVEEVWPGTQVAPSWIDNLNLFAGRGAQEPWRPRGMPARAAQRPPHAESPPEQLWMRK